MVNQLKASELQRIRSLYFTNDPEDRFIAFNWLSSSIGKVNAEANFFILEFHRDWDDDRAFRMDAENYWEMQFSTYKVYFGKNYRYRVTFKACFMGKLIVDSVQDYSRYSVGIGEPKGDFYCKVKEFFESNNYTVLSNFFYRIE